MSVSAEQRYLVREIPADALFGAIAEEASLRDADLDALEARLESSEATDPGELSAIALAVGRAGRRRSAGPLQRARARLESLGRPVEAQAVTLAMDLLRPRPLPARVSRADSGYVHRDITGGIELFVEDPVAAHWHAKGRWGPPLRPDLDRTPLAATSARGVDGLAAEALDGGLVVVCFKPRRLLGGPQAPLRLTRAGLARDPNLRTLVRWSQVRSVGVVVRGWTRSAAFEVEGEPLEILPPHPSLDVDALVELMTVLLETERGRPPGATA